MKKIALGITGSFCTHSALINVLDELTQMYDVIPVFSYSVCEFDTRFFKQSDFERLIIHKTGKTPLKSIVEAENLTKVGLDCTVIAPCTGNTIAKLAHGITDTPVTMTAKATLRTEKPVILSVSSNDALGANAQNIGSLLNTKNVFFVPFSQDDSIKKPHSLIADMSLLIPTIENALNGKQLQPILR